MPRLLIGIALIAIAYWGWRQLQQKLSERGAANDAGHSIATVRCELCGMHVPQQQARRHNAHWYCCQEHLQEAEKHSG